VSNWLTEAEARELLIRRIEALGSQAKVAQLAGCSPSLVSAVVYGDKPLGRKLATYLGLIAQPVRTFQYLRAR
jgi:hypothetical protein